MSNVPEAKSLRWLAIQFPFIQDPKDDTDKLSNAIHLYATAGADCIDRLSAEVATFYDFWQRYKPGLIDLLLKHGPDVCAALLDLRKEVSGNA